MSSDEFQVKEEEPESPQRTNQELGDPVEEEKATFREQLANTWQAREDTIFWLGFFATPNTTEEFEQLTVNLDLESGNPRKSG